MNHSLYKKIILAVGVDPGAPEILRRLKALFAGEFPSKSAEDAPSTEESIPGETKTADRSFHFKRLHYSYKLKLKLFRKGYTFIKKETPSHQTDYIYYYHSCTFRLCL